MAKSVKTTVTPEMHQDIIRSVDWGRVSRLTDEAIAKDIARDPDAMAFTDADGMALRIQMIRKATVFLVSAELSRSRFFGQSKVVPESEGWTGPGFLHGDRGLCRPQARFAPRGGGCTQPMLDRVSARGLGG